MISKRETTAIKETIHFMQKCQYLYTIIDNYLGKHNLSKLTPIKTESLSKSISIEEIKVSNFYSTKKGQGPNYFEGNITKFLKSRYIKCCSRGEIVKENPQTSFMEQA